MSEPAANRRLRSLVIYESMYGNTRAVAESIAEGLAELVDVRVLPVSEVAADDVAACDLLVVGAPTHAWGLSRPSTRKAAADAAGKPGSGLVMDPTWDVSPSMRTWLGGLTTALPMRAAAFDTRMRAPLGLSGSAARKIARSLRRTQVPICAHSKGFIVTRANRLAAGELGRARVWGRHLAGLASAATLESATR